MLITWPNFHHVAPFIHLAPKSGCLNYFGLFDLFDLGTGLVRFALLHYSPDYMSIWALHFYALFFEDIQPVIGKLAGFLDA